MKEECKTCKFLSGEGESILETKYWSVVLEPNQGYLGQCFVNLNQHKGSLTVLTDDEWIDFSNVVKQLEGAIREAFGPKLFNWTCLMNNAFRADYPNPHVHWSVVPRYSGIISFVGIDFTDPQFGRHYDTKHLLEVPDEAVLAIQQEIKANLK